MISSENTSRPQQKQPSRVAGAPITPPRRRAVLHLMNGVGDSSITSIVVDQLKQWHTSGYDWHIAGLKGVAANEPFSALGAAVADFSGWGGGQFGLLKRIRRYVREHGIHLVHCHTPRTTMAAALALGRRRSTRLLTTKHLNVKPAERRTFGFFFLLVDRLACYVPDHIVAVSEDVGARLQALRWIRAEKITIIRNAVDAATYDVPDEREDCRAEFAVGADETVLGFAGRLTRQKRLDLLLEAFAIVLRRHGNCRLLLAGQGEEEAELRALADRLEVAGKVIWAGHRRDMPRVFAAIDMYVQSSDNEGLSLSLLQAMIARKAVVATDVGGTREVVNEQTGILVDAGSAALLVDAIIHLLEQPAHRKRLTAKAHALVSREFGVATQMERYRKVYERLLDERR